MRLGEAIRLLFWSKWWLVEQFSFLFCSRGSLDRFNVLFRFWGGVVKQLFFVCFKECLLERLFFLCALKVAWLAAQFCFFLRGILECILRCKILCHSTSFYLNLTTVKNKVTFPMLVYAWNDRPMIHLRERTCSLLNQSYLDTAARRRPRIVYK